MTILMGNLQSVSGTPFGGPGCNVVIYSRLTRPGFAVDGLVLELQDRIPMPVSASGHFETEDLDPGPIRVELEGGTVHGRGWDIDLPESGTHSLASLIDAQVEWSPVVVSRSEAAARAAVEAQGGAESARDKAEEYRDTAKGHLDNIVIVVNDAEGHATTAGEHAEQTADDRRQTGEDRTQTGLDRQAAETARNQAQAAAVRTPRILIHTGTGDPVLTTFPDAQVGDLIERVSDGARWKVEAS